MSKVTEVEKALDDLVALGPSTESLMGWRTAWFWVTTGSWSRISHVTGLITQAFDQFQCLSDDEQACVQATLVHLRDKISTLAPVLSGPSCTCCTTSSTASGSESTSTGMPRQLKDELRTVSECFLSTFGRLAIGENDQDRVAIGAHHVPEEVGGASEFEQQMREALLAAAQAPSEATCEKLAAASSAWENTCSIGTKERLPRQIDLVLSCFSQAPIGLTSAFLNKEFLRALGVRVDDRQELIALTRACVDKAPDVAICLLAVLGSTPEDLAAADRCRLYGEVPPLLQAVGMSDQLLHMRASALFQEDPKVALTVARQHPFLCHATELMIGFADQEHVLLLRPGDERLFPTGVASGLVFGDRLKGLPFSPLVSHALSCAVMYMDEVYGRASYGVKDVRELDFRILDTFRTFRSELVKPENREDRMRLLAVTFDRSRPRPPFHNAIEMAMDLDPNLAGPMGTLFAVCRLGFATYGGDGEYPIGSLVENVFARKLIVGAESEILASYDAALRLLEKNEPEAYQVVALLDARFHFRQLVKSWQRCWEQGTDVRIFLMDKRTLFVRLSRMLWPLLWTLQRCSQREYLVNALSLEASGRLPSVVEQQTLSRGAVGRFLTLAHLLKGDPILWQRLHPLLGSLVLAQAGNQRESSLDEEEAGQSTLLPFFVALAEEQGGVLHRRFMQVMTQWPQETVNGVLIAAAKLVSCLAGSRADAGGVTKERREQATLALTTLITLMEEEVRAGHTPSRILEAVRALSSGLGCLYHLDQAFDSQTLSEFLRAPEADPARCVSSLQARVSQNLVKALQLDPSARNLQGIARIFAEWQQPEMLVSYCAQHAAGSRVRQVFSLWLAAAIEGPEALQRLQFVTGRHGEIFAKLPPEMALAWKNDWDMTATSLEEYLLHPSQRYSELVRGFADPACLATLCRDRTPLPNTSQGWDQWIKETKRHVSAQPAQKVTVVKIQALRALTELRRLSPAGFKDKSSKWVNSLEKNLIQQRKLLVPGSLSEEELIKVGRLVKQLHLLIQEKPCDLTGMTVGCTSDAKAKWEMVGLADTGSCQYVGARNSTMNAALMETVVNGAKKVLFLRDRQGELVARAILKLGLANTMTWTLLCEPIHYSEHPQVSLEEATQLLLGAAVRIATGLKCNLVGVIPLRLASQRSDDWSCGFGSLSIPTGIVGLDYEEAGKQTLVVGSEVSVQSDQINSLVRQQL